MSDFERTIGRRVATGQGMVLMGVLVVALASVPAWAAPQVSSPQPARNQIEDLVVCYALGTDAIGRAVDAIGDQPLDSTVNISGANFSEGFAEGLALYRECFADGFSFTLEFDGVPALTVPDPSTATASTDAALQWANFVNNAFRAPGYSNTQHHMGTIRSSAHGNTGTAQSYLIATHSYGPTSARTGVNVVGGTYRDEVVRVRGRWLIQQRTLNITSSVNVPDNL